MRRHLLLPPLVALVLSGCLLPQPDTPILPPRGVPRSNPDVPMAAPRPTQEGAADVGGARQQPVVLAGRIEGAAIARLRLLAPGSETATAETAVSPDGSFRLEAPAGDYVLEFQREAAVARTQGLVSLRAGAPLELTIVLDEARSTARITQTTPLVSPAPSPSPTGRP